MKGLLITHGMLQPVLLTIHLLIHFNWARLSSVYLSAIKTQNKYKLHSTFDVRKKFWKRHLLMCYATLFKLHLATANPCFCVCYSHNKSLLFSPIATKNIFYWNCYSVLRSWKRHLKGEVSPSIKILNIYHGFIFYFINGETWYFIITVLMDDTRFFFYKKR